MGRCIVYTEIKFPAAYLSLYFFIFLSLQFSSFKNFCHIFLRNFEAEKVETWYTREQWVDVLFVCLFVLGFYGPVNEVVLSQSVNSGTVPRQA